MTVTPAMLKELRERTGVGMAKCKEALQNSNGDIELAIDNLRKAGLASAAKKEGREANEGLIGVADTDKVVALIEINSETDFVAKNDKFRQFLTDMALEVANTQPSSVEEFLNQKFSKDPSLTVNEYRGVLIQSLGENIQFRRLISIPKATDQSIGVYSHMKGRIVCVVEISGSANQAALAKDIAMHVAAAAPEFLSSDEMPENVKAREEEIARSQMKGKPANIIDKIIEGKMRAFYDQVCLLQQDFVKEPGLSIKELVAKHAKETEKPLKLTSFKRWQLGGQG